MHLFHVNGNAKKWLFLLLNGTQYARQKNGGTQYARGEGGVTLNNKGNAMFVKVLV